MINFNWQTFTYPFTKPYIQFSDFIFNNSPIYQFVNFQTRGDHILDLILSNNSTLVKQLIPNAPLGMSDHVTLGVLNFTYSTPKHATLKYFKNFKNADYDSITNFLNCKVATFKFCDNPEINFDFLMNIINFAIEKFIPLKQVKVKNNKIILERWIHLYKKNEKVL